MGNYSFERSIKTSSLFGIQGGVSERLDIGRFYIKPMLLTGYQSGMPNYTSNEGVVSSYKVDYGNVEFPFNVGAKITGPFSLEAGPLFNWVYKSQYYEDKYISFNPAGYGYRIAANMELGKAFLSLAYQGFTNDTMGIYSAAFKSPAAVTLNVGYSF